MIEVLEMFGLMVACSLSAVLIIFVVILCCICIFDDWA